MRKLLTVVALVAAILGTSAPQIGARKLIGCDSLLNWPCPGPAL